MTKYQIKWSLKQQHSITFGNIENLRILGELYWENGRHWQPVKHSVSYSQFAWKNSFWVGKQYSGEILA